MAEVVKLKVAEAIQDDVNKGIVRVDSNYIHQLGLKPGDIVQIEGQKATVSVIDRAYPGDIGLNIIRMDGITRRNSKSSIGEYVKLTKVQAKEAQKLSVAPSQKGLVIRAPPQIFKQGLLGKAVVKGDIVTLGGAKRRKTTTSANPFFNEIFNMMETMDDSFGLSGFGLSDLKFVVVETTPAKVPVVIGTNTEIEYTPEAVEVTEDQALEVTYEDVGGLSEEVRKIRELVELPLKHPEIFQQLGIEPPKGILLHGPPGTGKTLLAKAVANETNSHFILINGPEIMSKFYGESEANLRKKFEEAEKNAPSIIFIDEIDAIATSREEAKGEVERRVVAQLLTMMDGLKSRGRVVVIAATNMPNTLDPALRRPGRFDREIEISPPSKEGRLNILKIHTRSMPIEGSVYGDLLEPIYTQQLKTELEQTLHQQKVKSAIITQTQEQIASIQKQITQVTKQLEQLEDKKKKQPDENIVYTILAQIKSLTTNKKQFEQQLKDLSKEHEDALKAVSDATTEIEVLEKLTQETLSDEKKIKELISEIVEVESALARQAETDPRKLFGEKKLTSLYAKLRESRFYHSVVHLAKAKAIPRDLEEIADKTHGFVGADLASLSKEAAMVVLRKVLPEIALDKEEEIPPEVLEKLKIRKDDFVEALKFVRPSALREFMIEVPNVRWSDVGGLDSIRQQLLEAVEWPINKPEIFVRMGIKPPKGILLYGPPGTGKTLLAKAVAKETKANFILVNGPELLSKWVGDSEKAIRKVFAKARQTAPTIIFFDEIDSIAPKRGGSDTDNHAMERVVNQLLTELDGLESLAHVVVMGATNRPDLLDSALLRPGRFDRIILAPVPTEHARERIFEIHSKTVPLDSSVSLKQLAKQTQGYVGADIEAICREAALHALRDNIDATQVSFANFQHALQVVKPSVSAEIEEMYKKLAEQFRMQRSKELKENTANYFG
jgi:CDC48 subfamily AAA family ATPase